MLETVREYASGWLELAGETAMMRRRMRDYTLRECEQLAAIGMARVRAPWSARVDVFRRVDLEAANLREVLSACLADGDAETGLRICTAIRPVWIVRGAFADGAAWLDAFLELPAVAGLGARIGPRPSPGRPRAAGPGHGIRAGRGARHGRPRAVLGGRRAVLGSGRAQPADRDRRCTPAGRTRRPPGQRRRCRWPGPPATAGTRATRSAPWPQLRPCAATCAKRSGWARRRWPSCAPSSSCGARPGCCSGLATWPGCARRTTSHGIYYLEALAILREVNARPEIARCLAGLGRIAMSQSDLPAARQHLTESLQLSFAVGQPDRDRARPGGDRAARGPRARSRAGRSAGGRGLGAARRRAPAADAGGQDAAIPGRRRRPGRACRDAALAGRHGHDASGTPSGWHWSLARLRRRAPTCRRQARPRAG